MRKQEHENAFNVLRVMAALAVIFSHHFPITGTNPPAWLHSNMVGGVAVMTFFSISGYLVMLSWQRDPRFLAFFAKRLLRLWPGMFVAVVFGGVILGPIFTRLPAIDYFVHKETHEYFMNLFLSKSYVNLPAVFYDNPLKGLMNGPLWTIPMELMCYAALALLGFFGFLKSRWLATFLALIYLVYFLSAKNADVAGSMQHWWEYPAYFVFGALLAIHCGFFLKWRWWVLAVILPIFVVVFFVFKLEHSAGLLILPPLLIALGSVQGRFFSWVSKFGDPSYGIYVLGCPIQQIVQAMAPQMPFLMSMAIAMTAAVAIGYASWHLVESPALKFKRFVS